MFWLVLDILQAAASAAIAAVTSGNKKNQDAVVAEGAVKYVYLHNTPQT